MRDEVIDQWLRRSGLVNTEPLGLDARGWARARIERLLDPRPLPNGAWLFLPTLRDLHEHASAAERVALFRRTSVPRHDDAMRWLAPFEAELLAALEASPPTLRGVNLDDTYAVLLALAAVRCRRALSLPFDSRWEPFIARDLSLYDRFEFDATRAALAALSEDRRLALVRASIERGEVMAAQVLDSLPFDASLFESALDLVLRTEPGSEHGASPTQGLARCGLAAVPSLLARLARPKVPAAEMCVLLNALAWIRAPESADALVAATGHGSAAVRACALRATAALSESARDAVLAGARARKAALREACEWLRSLLEGTSTAPLRAVRDAHATLDEGARRAIAASRESGWVNVRDALAPINGAVVIEATDRWCEGDPTNLLPRAFSGDHSPGTAWALAWLLVTRPMHRKHYGCVVDALRHCADRADVVAWLQRAPSVTLAAAGKAAT